MAGSQTLRFDIVGDGSSASRTFRQVAADSALAARGAKQLSDSLGIQSKTAQVSAGATLALANSDKALAEAEALLAGATDEATNKLQAQGRAAEDTAVKTRLAGDAAKSAGGGFGVLGTPLGAAVAAGVALAPVLVTASVGLAGLGAAAISTVGPILQAGTATAQAQQALAGLDPAQRAAYTSLGLLKTQFSGFSKALQPEVLGIFNAGLHTASGLLGDVEPVAAATGKALGGVLGEVDAEFRSGTWQKFFGFMAASAGPDVKQLGGLFTSLLGVLPPLLEDLQPAATGLITLATGAAQAAGDVALLVNSLPDLRDKLNSALAPIEKGIPKGNENIFQVISDGVNWISAHVPDGNKTLLQLATNTGATGTAAAKAAPQVGTLSGDLGVLDSSAATAAGATQALSDAWLQFVGKSVSDQQAVLAVASAFDSYNSSAKTAGATSTAAQQAFLGIITAMGSGLATLQANGASVGQLNSFYQANIDKLNQLHNLTPAERKDVQDVTRDYTAWANSTSGLTGQVTAAAGALKNDFLAQIGSIAAHVPGVSGDVTSLANAILKTGDQSSATRADRQQLITDLEKAGLTADAARGLVSKLQGQIDAMHGKTVAVGATAHGSGSITATENILGEKSQKLGNLTFVAAGGKVTGGVAGRDSVLMMGMPGEVVVPAHMVAAGAVDHLRGKLPGFAAGGVVGQAIPDWMGTEGSAFIKGAANAGSGPLLSAFLAAAGAAVAAGGSPVAYSKVAGVTQWEPDVSRVLAMLGLPQADLPTVMSQMLTESGGNPNAINLTDSNAAAGTPSKGLMQVIGPTFAAYRNPSLSSNIYDPLANIYAGLNYAVHRYGNPGWLSVLGHGHGYDNGGYLPTGLSLAWNGTGRPEPVIPAGRGAGGPVHVHLHNEGVIGSQAELMRWLHDGIDELARGSKLTYALQRSPSAGRP